MRIRANFVQGLLGDAALTGAAGATTMNSSGLASLPTVAGADVAAITLDPAAQNGASEIVYVTAHTASATTATVLRAQEGTVQRPHQPGETWQHDITAGDFTDTVVAGVMQMYCGAVAPSGWLLCQGQAVSRTQYAALYAAIGTAFGAGDGSTTFNLPDMRTRVPVGVGAFALGAVGGEQNHQLTAGEMPSHQHTDPGHTHGVTDPGHAHAFHPGSAAGGGANPADSVNTGADTFYVTSSVTGIALQTANSGLAAAGGGAAHNNMQPYSTVNYIVKY